jgi:hypothetical protein
MSGGFSTGTSSVWRLTQAEFLEQCRIDPDLFIRWQKFFPKAHVRVKAKSERA